MPPTGPPRGPTVPAAPAARVRARAAPVRATVLSVVLATAVTAASGCAATDPVPPLSPVAQPSAAAATSATSAADRLAGVLDRTVPPSGPGVFDVAHGSAPAPARARIVPVRVEVERGLRIDPDAFATFVLATLNDRRSWGKDGSLGFARTAGEAPIQVVLATPETTDRLCAPLETGDGLSCRSGPRAVLNLERWVGGVPDYRADPTGYRQYMVNHEVGHVLGHGHVTCPGPGLLAPVMLQQTLGLDGCRPNPWPYP